MKTILLTGVSGQVGHALQQCLQASQQQPFSLVCCDRQQLDLSQPEQIRQVVRTVAPDLIINPAAYTAVDLAESEQERAFAINAVAPQVLAEEAARLNAALIHFSTDYVYDGRKASPYVETDPVQPMSVYGASKLAGEDAIRQVGVPHLILRTSWVYGSYGKNFLKTILRLARERETLRIVADQYGAPTADICIARAVVDLVQQWNPDQAALTGVYHLVSRGETSWHGFASEIVAQYQALAQTQDLTLQGLPPLMVKQIEAIATEDYPVPAKRPANSRLATDKLAEVFNVTLPDWQQALQEVMRAVTSDAR